MLKRRRGRRIGILLGVVLASASASEERVERRVGYAEAGASGLDRSYDLHLARQDVEGGGALVVFIHGRFWRERQPEALIEGAFVPGLVAAGHSIAVVRHRLGSEGRHPAAIEDVARAVAALLDRVEAGEFDRDRVFLAGHSSGAQLALLLALDPSWLRAVGKDPAALAGVVSISGILDLAPDAARSEEEEAFYAAAFPDPGARIAASPAAHTPPHHPAILLVTAARDVPGYRRAAVRLANALRAEGPDPVEAFIANGRDHFSILALADPRNDVRRHVFDFLASDPRAGRLPRAWRILATWRNPPYTTEDFHERFPKLIEEYPADERFLRAANRPFQMKPGSPPRLKVRGYRAIELIRLLEALGPDRIGKGDWLEIRNVRGEWTSFSMADLRERSPRLVIGVDGERNLFRATDLYHTLRRYSWVDPEPERIDMARPLGAFLHFPAEEPSFFTANEHFGRYALTIDSFRLVESDPLAPLADLDEGMRAVLTRSPDCLACHRFRDIGGRAHHLRAVDGHPMGGHALPLERYPAVVWKRFVFDQASVAEEVGATPLSFEPDVARALYDLVVREREARGVESWTHPERDRIAD